MENLISDNDPIYDELDRLYDEDKFDRIIEIIEEIPEERQSNKLRFRLIGAYNNTERYDDARRALNDIFPKCQKPEELARYWYQYGYICYKTDHELAAKHLYEKGLSADPNDALDLKNEIKECDRYITEDLQKLSDTAYRVKDTLKKHCYGEMGRIKARVSDEGFTLRLSYLSAVRKIPGTNEILGINDFLKKYPDREKPIVRTFLKQHFGITDFGTLAELCDKKMSYNLTMVLGNVCSSAIGKPNFDMDKLTDDGRELMGDLMLFVSSIMKFLPEKGGVTAWDICEKIGFSRMAYACGVISEKEYRAIAERQTDFAKRCFSAFDEYLTSLVLGSGLFVFLEDNRSIKSAISYINSIMPIVLLGDAPDIMWNK